MKRDQARIPTATGGCTLLTALAVLCLCTLSLLAIHTARTGQSMTEGSVSAIRSYYEADSQAEAVFARLRLGQLPDGVEESGGIYRYSCAISESQALEVTLRRSGEDWEVLRWQAVVSDISITEPTLDVWDGEEKEP